MPLPSLYSPLLMLTVALGAFGCGDTTVQTCLDPDDPFATIPCERRSEEASSGSGGASGGTNTGGSFSTGGAASGGASSGGAASGGASSGGAAATGGTDGTATGGALGSGGEASGGEASGGAPSDSLLRTGPCYDEPCDGICVGTCEKGFACDEASTELCSAAFTTFCGCDGESFLSPAGCSNRAFSQRGACEEAETYDCDPRGIVCVNVAPVEPCGPGLSYSVVDGCYGACVPTDSCRCIDAASCDPLDTEESVVCNEATGRCQEQ